ncbi:alpha/beta-hydrolase, partial [Sporormia fimetaria CBS 119925]
HSHLHSTAAMDILRYQPFKGLYALSATVFELLRLPLWFLKYITPLGRQHAQWSFRQAFSVRLFFSVVHHIARLQIKTPLPLTPGKEKERFLVIAPPSDSYFIGPFAPTQDVKPVPTGASWYPAPLTASSDTASLTVVLHLHGGAYVLGDGRTQASGYFVSKLLKHAGATHVLAPQYRLSSLPAGPGSNPFPAAVQDCLAAYLYLMKELRISPKNIVLSGDSAGANAAISLLRYITEYGEKLDIPAPSAAWLWSPWVSPKSSIHREQLHSNRNYGSDYLSYNFTAWGGYAYAGSAGPEFLESEYISHGGKPFRTHTPLWVNTGGAEVLYFDDCEWANMMMKAGNDVTLDVEEKVPHDVLLVGASLGFDAEATACAKRAGLWLKEARK